ncbi:MAG: BamA/TamA family outer membrane protein [Chlorobi bacterium]|nr:BamA/TamA family outer membrane protein [Chlorobiota bacterium]
MFGVKISAQETGAEKKTSSHVTSEFFAYPYVFYTPEKKLAFGGGGILSLRDTSRTFSKPSKFVFSAYYTTASQFLVYLNPEFYFKKEKYLLTGLFWIERLIEKFYGYGSTTDDIDEPFYKLFDFTANISANYAFTRKFLIGLQYYYEYVTSLDFMQNTLLKNGMFLGTEGGTNSGLGIRLFYDSRDNIFYPSEGFYNEIQATFFSKSFGGNYDFNSYLIDIRKYFSLSENQILAVEAYFTAVYGSPPFYSYPRLGGYRRMRGYYEGRFRDRNYYAVQAELRTFVFWRFYGVIFAGAGDVSDKLVNFTAKNIKPSYGVGIRFRLDEQEKINLRLDIGFGKNTNGVYFQVEEAF